MAALEIQLLGRYALRVDGRERPAPPTAKARALLAYLAMHPYAEHARDKLAELLWPESEPERSRPRLSNAIWWLRKSLEDSEVREALVATKTTVALNASVAVDTLEFSRFAKGASEAEQRAAIALYRGEFLEGDDDEWPVGEREHLASLYESALESVLEHRDDVEIARAILQRNPYHERAYGIAIDDALRKHRLPLARALFARACGALAEIGSDVCASFERRYPKLASKAEAPRGALPQPLTPLIGRQRELERALELLDAHRLVTIAGPGGVGKTRLAMEAARHCSQALADGAYWVDLASIGEPEMVVSAIAAVLEVTSKGELSTAAAIQAMYSERAFAIVLDNCEHLLEVCAETVATLLDSIPGLVVLTTSREPLDVHGEQVLLLDPMDERDGIRLFVERAPPSAHLGTGKEERSSVAAIVRALDGLPLAIELAAAMLATMSPVQMLAALERHVVELETSKRSVTQRHRSLSALIGWSYELLAEQEQRMFACASVFTGRFSAQAASAVYGGDDATALALVSSLVRKSLLHVDRIPGIEPYFYRMLETVRQFAEERLVRDEKLAYESALARWYGGVAREANRRYTTVPAREWVAALACEEGNLLAALARGLGATGAGLIAAAWLAGELRRYFELTGRVREGIRWYEAYAAALPPDAPTELRALLHAERSRLHLLGTDVDEALAAGQEAVALARGLNDRKLLHYALDQLGNAEMFAERLDDAHEHLQESLAIAATLEVGDLSIASTLGHLAVIALYFRHDVAGAESYLNQVVPLYRNLHHEANLAWATGLLAEIAYRKEEFGEALMHARHAVEQYREIGEHANLAAELERLGRVLLALDRKREACVQLAEARERFDALERPDGLAEIVFDFAVYAAKKRRWEKAAMLLGSIAKHEKELTRSRLAEWRRWKQETVSAVGAERFDRILSSAARMGMNEALDAAFQERLKRTTSRGCRGAKEPNRSSSSPGATAR